MPIVDEEYGHKLKEYELMKKSADLVGLSTQEVFSRLERANDLILMMMMAFSEPEPVKTLEAIDVDIDRVIEKLVDTKTILRMVIREKELVQKLKKLDEAKKLSDFSALSAEDVITAGDLENPNIDPATKERLKQQIEIHNLIDSIQASTQNEEVKKKLDKLHSLTGLPRLFRFKKIALPGEEKFSLNPIQDRLHRTLDIAIPTFKGKGYERPGGEE